MAGDRWMRKAEIRKLFLAKQKRRRELAGLPIERKIRVLVSMQRMAVGLSERAGGANRRPWDV